MKLSIITINYNDKVGLKRTIDSVVAQSFKDYEWIVIDGGSTDGSRELIEQYADHFAYWVSEPDNGIYNAMNKGIAKAKGEYLQFLNSGDWIYDEAVLGKVFSQRHDEDILFATKHMQYYEDGREIVVERKFGDSFTPFNLIYQTICHQSAFIRRSLFDQIGYYDETYRIVSDRKFFFQAFLIKNVTRATLDFFIVYFGANGMSTKQDSWMEKERLLREFLPDKSVMDYYDWVRNLNALQKYKKTNQHAIEVYEELSKHWLTRKMMTFFYLHYSKKH